MNKQSLLEQTYNSAFQGELEKIAANLFPSVDKKLAESKKALSKAEAKYIKTLKPYKKEREVIHKAGKIGAISGAVIGGLSGRGNLRNNLGKQLIKATIGAGIGGISAASVAGNTISYINPKYKSTFNKAIKDYQKAEDKIYR